MLTDTEIEKLKKTDPVRDKANDFIVRRKFKKWLDGLFVVSAYILRYLPEKQLAKIIKYDHINQLSFILINFLWAAGAVPIIEKNDGNGVVVIPDHAPRPSTVDENRLNFLIKDLIEHLLYMLSAEDARSVIQHELDCHQPDYILVRRAFDEYPNPTSKEELPTATGRHVTVTPYPPAPKKEKDVLEH